MIPGQYYQHTLAPDSYIRVRDVFEAPDGMKLIKCEVYTKLSPAPWETTQFWMSQDHTQFWKKYTPEAKRAE